MATLKSAKASASPWRIVLPLFAVAISVCTLVAYSIGRSAPAVPAAPMPATIDHDAAAREWNDWQAEFQPFKAEFLTTKHNELLWQLLTQMQFRGYEVGDELIKSYAGLTSVGIVAGPAREGYREEWRLVRSDTAGMNLEPGRSLLRIGFDGQFDYMAADRAFTACWDVISIPAVKFPMNDFRVGSDIFFDAREMIRTHGEERPRKPFKVVRHDREQYIEIVTLSAVGELYGFNCMIVAEQAVGSDPAQYHIDLDFWPLPSNVP